MRQVLFDLSVLRTGARTRGIGRYVASLGEALASEAQAYPGLELTGLEALSYSGASSTSGDMVAAIARLASAPRESHAAWAYRLRLTLARTTRKLRPDLLHQGHPNATPLGKLRCPRVVTAHDLIPLRYPDRYLDYRDGWYPGRLRLDHRRYASADHVIAISETTANDLVTLLGISPKKISVVYNGVDLRLWTPEPEGQDRSVRDRFALSDKVYALYVGAGDWRKNFDGMLSAVIRARRLAPELDLVLAWAAELDEGTRGRIAARLAEAGAPGAVQLLGYVSDAELGSLMRGAAAQLFVSRAEGFGYPVVEAMAAGCPVITSDLSSMAEVAADAAITVDPEDHAAIARALVTLADSATERRRYSAAGVARARHFSIQRMARGTLDVYESLTR
ncbi:MAG: glycosyltransferase family 4 protein [Myxococcales bacterium]|nr:glycosyltransferase family 4 protein [Myxococcales bacterium]